MKLDSIVRPKMNPYLNNPINNNKCTFHLTHLTYTDPPQSLILSLHAISTQALVANASSSGLSSTISNRPLFPPSAFT
jgi:hypothetical protein